MEKYVKLEMEVTRYDVEDVMYTASGGAACTRDQQQGCSCDNGAYS